jgi:hypothetical protein
MNRKVLAAICVMAVGLLGARAVGLSLDEPARPAAGIYISTPGKSGASALVRIPGAMPQQVKTKGIGKMILTQGLLKPSMMTQLAGPIADFRIATSSPLFYVSLNAQTKTPSASDPFAGFSGMMGGDVMPPGARTGADFSLVRLTVTSDARQADLGKVGSSGGKLKNSIECAEERVAQGEYQLRPKEPLQPGEYAFFFAGSMGAASSAGTAWPFGVDAAK